MFNRRQLAFLKPWIILLGLLALALVARVPALNTFATADEPNWIYRSQLFLGGLLYPDYVCSPAKVDQKLPTAGLGCTLQTGHPGVTTMWGGAVGLLAYYRQVASPSGVDLRSFLKSTDLPNNPAVLASMRLPLAVMGALFVLLFYWLVRRLFDEKTALIAALLVALSPFHIALSRVLHHDAMTTTFMLLSLLPMIGYWLCGWGRRWLFISAIFAGLAFLSKAVGWFMMPCAAMIGLLSLYYHWKGEGWRGWRSVTQVAGEGVVWGAVAWLTFAALFPAMWVIPGQVISTIVAMNFGEAQAGHDVNQYFLGSVAGNPGPLLYPIGWLLRASPLEVLGLLALPAAAWGSFRSLGAIRRPSAAALRQKIASHPAAVALALFVVMFLLFETIFSKKGVRYFLPAFPVIDIFVAVGLLWMADRLARLLRKELIQRWALPALSGLVLVGQGWLVAGNYPYYFTYYNPLLGGAPGAAKVMDVGWGEGMNEAGDYLNRQPGSASLLVTADYDATLTPFFAGEVNRFTGQIDETMKSDYLVFYRRYLQGGLHDPNLWRYFEQHYQPVQPVTLQGLDYALIYRNPIEQHLCAQDNSRPDVLMPFGYNLDGNGNLTVFWQNVKGNDRPPALQLQAGLTSAAGGNTLSQRDPERWVACAPAPAFAAEAGMPGALLESQCSLATSGAPPGLYGLSLGLGDGGQVAPITSPAGGLAVVIDTDQHFTSAASPTALPLLAKQGLVTPLNVAFGNTASLAGYWLPMDTWQAGGDGTLVLYWQPQRRLSSAAAGIFQLSLRLFAPGAAEPIATATYPVLPLCQGGRDLMPETLAPVRYPLALPPTLPPGAYTLKVCVTAGSAGEAVTGTRAGGASQPLDCLPLPVTVAH